jgi:hypothetical protein
MKQQTPITQDTKDTLLDWVNSDLMTEEKAQLIIALLNDKYSMGFDHELMEKLGFKSFDWAKPQRYMDELRSHLQSNEVLQGTVWDYTNNRICGQLESAMVRFVKHVLQTLGN